MKIYNIKRFLKVLCVILLVLFFTLITQNRVDHNSLRIKGFYLEEKDSLDVVFVGASEIYTGFASGQAYDEYGFTSYPYAVESNAMDLYSYEIKEVLREQNPRLLVVEINGALYNGSLDCDDANLRRITDCIPISENKVDMLNRYADKDNLLSYYFPFIKYHGSLSSFRNCWNEVFLNYNGKSILKGLTTETISQEFKVISIDNPYQKEDLHPIAEQKFREFMDFCNSNVDTKILFVRFPHAITSERSYKRFLMGNKIGDIINEYGYNYINFESKTEEIGIDFKKDFYNEDHMNVFGQKKFTSYLGEIIKNNIKDETIRLTKEQKDNWDKTADYTYRFYDYAEDCINKHKDVWLFESIDLISSIDN